MRTVSVLFLASVAMAAGNDGLLLRRMEEGEEATPQPTTTTTTTTVNVNELTQTVFAELTEAGVQHEKGAWLYCDWRSYSRDQTPTASDCYQKCKDEGCQHWNFHVVNAKCDLKKCDPAHPSDGYHEQSAGWVTGEVNGVSGSTRRLKGSMKEAAGTHEQEI